jgi:hypothetical protein
MYRSFNGLLTKFSHVRQRCGPGNGTRALPVDPLFATTATDLFPVPLGDSRYMAMNPSRHVGAVNFHNYCVHLAISERGSARVASFDLKDPAAGLVRGNITPIIGEADDDVQTQYHLERIYDTHDPDELNWIFDSMLSSLPVSGPIQPEDEFDELIAAYINELKAI